MAPYEDLRAVVGIDGAGTLDAAEEPTQRLATGPTNRRHMPFDAPLALLAGLQGPWSSEARDDYALVRIGAATPMRVSRSSPDQDPHLDEESAQVRPTVQAIAQLLGDNGETVMAFLPRSKHDSFTAATELVGFGAVNPGATVLSLLDLADAELGVPSLLEMR